MDWYFHGKMVYDDWNGEWKMRELNRIKLIISDGGWQYLSRIEGALSVEYWYRVIHPIRSKFIPEDWLYNFYRYLPYNRFIIKLGKIIGV
jgi:hypothetical protein